MSDDQWRDLRRRMEVEEDERAGAGGLALLRGAHRGLTHMAGPTDNQDRTEISGDAGPAFPLENVPFGRLNCMTGATDGAAASMEGSKFESMPSQLSQRRADSWYGSPIPPMAPRPDRRMAASLNCGGADAGANASSGSDGGGRADPLRRSNPQAPDTRFAAAARSAAPSLGRDGGGGSGSGSAGGRPGTEAEDAAAAADRAAAPSGPAGGPAAPAPAAADQTDPTRAPPPSEGGGGAAPGGNRAAELMAALDDEIAGAETDLDGWLEAAVRRGPAEGPKPPPPAPGLSAPPDFWLEAAAAAVDGAMALARAQSSGASSRGSGSSFSAGGRRGSSFSAGGRRGSSTVARSVGPAQRLGPCVASAVVSPLMEVALDDRVEPVAPPPQLHRECSRGLPGGGRGDDGVWPYRGQGAHWHSQPVPAPSQGSHADASHAVTGQHGQAPGGGVSPRMSYFQADRGLLGGGQCASTLLACRSDTPVSPFEHGHSQDHPPPRDQDHPPPDHRNVEDEDNDNEDDDDDNYDGNTKDYEDEYGSSQDELELDDDEPELDDDDNGPDLDDGLLDARDLLGLCTDFGPPQPAHPSKEAEAAGGLSLSGGMGFSFPPPSPPPKPSLLEDDSDEEGEGPSPSLPLAPLPHFPRPTGQAHHHHHSPHDNLHHRRPHHFVQSQSQDASPALPAAYGGHRQHHAHFDDSLSRASSMEQRRVEEELLGFGLAAKPVAAGGGGPGAGYGRSHPCSRAEQSLAAAAAANNDLVLDDSDDGGPSPQAASSPRGVPVPLRPPVGARHRSVPKLPLHRHDHDDESAATAPPWAPLSPQGLSSPTLPPPRKPPRAPGHHGNPGERPPDRPAYHREMMPAPHLHGGASGGRVQESAKMPAHPLPRHDGGNAAERKPLGIERLDNALGIERPDNAFRIERPDNPFGLDGGALKDALGPTPDNPFGLEGGALKDALGPTCFDEFGAAPHREPAAAARRPRDQVPAPRRTHISELDLCGDDDDDDDDGSNVSFEAQDPFPSRARPDRSGGNDGMKHSALDALLRPDDPFGDVAGRITHSLETHTAEMGRALGRNVSLASVPEDVPHSAIKERPRPPRMGEMDAELSRMVASAADHAPHWDGGGAAGATPGRKAAAAAPFKGDYAHADRDRASHKTDNASGGTIASEIAKNLQESLCPHDYGAVEGKPRAHPQARAGHGGPQRGEAEIGAPRAASPDPIRETTPRAGGEPSLPTSPPGASKPRQGPFLVDEELFAKARRTARGEALGGRGAAPEADDALGDLLAGGGAAGLDGLLGGRARAAPKESCEWMEPPGAPSAAPQVSSISDDEEEYEHRRQRGGSRDGGDDRARAATGEGGDRMRDPRRDSFDLDDEAAAAFCNTAGDDEITYTLQRKANEEQEFKDRLMAETLFARMQITEQCREKRDSQLAASLQDKLLAEEEQERKERERRDAEYAAKMAQEVEEQEERDLRERELKDEEAAIELTIRCTQIQEKQEEQEQYNMEVARALFEDELNRNKDKEEQELADLELARTIEGKIKADMATALAEQGGRHGGHDARLAEAELRGREIAQHQQESDSGSMEQLLHDEEVARTMEYRERTSREREDEEYARAVQAMTFTGIGGESMSGHEGLDVGLGGLLTRGSSEASSEVPLSSALPLHMRRLIARCPERTLREGDRELLRSDSWGCSAHMPPRGQTDGRSFSVMGIMGQGGERSQIVGRHRQCAVCLDPYRVGERVRTIPCFHTFHTQCIDRWLGRKAECPICKYPAFG